MTDLLSVKKKNNCPKILIIGDASSALIRGRGLVVNNGGYEIHWYSRNPITIPGISMYSRPLKSLHKLSLIAQMLYIWFLIKKIKPSLVHVFWANHNLSNIVLCRQKPLIVTVMGGDILPGQRYNKWLDRFFTKMLLDNAQCITSKSYFLDKVLLGIGDYKDKISRVTWGVDFNIFTPGLKVIDLRRKLKISDKSFVFFSVRKCERFYNHHIVIDAFARLLKNKKNTDITLLVSIKNGGREYINELESLATRLNVLSQIRFIEAIPNLKMPVYYNLSNVIISMPNSDGMPQSHYEGMACGCFNILGDLPQYKELVENKINGVFAKARDSKDLAWAMRWVVDNPEIVENASRINREKVKKIANKKVQDKIVNKIYCELIRNSKCAE